MNPRTSVALMALAVCVQLASAASSKPGAFPLSRVIGQPESAVNKVLGNPDKRHELRPPEDFAGGTQVSYPDGPTWKALTTAFYRSKLTFIQFVFEPKPLSEEEFFTALGLPKANFGVIARRSGIVAATQYRGTINKHVIEIVAWRPSDRDGPGVLRSSHHRACPRRRKNTMRPNHVPELTATRRAYTFR